MKNNSTVLFLIGVILGGILMLSVVVSMNRTSFSNQPAVSPPTQDRSPQLIALEPTHLPQKPSLIPLTLTPVATRTALPTPVSPTPTALLLSNPQRSEVIGYSIEGRPLEVYKFGKGTQERMIVAGIHGGDEWNTVTLANQLIKYLNEHPEAVPDNVMLYILPDLNPDGEARAHNKYGHVNHNGVDLNRNFPVNWQEKWDRAGCWNYLPTSGGTGPGSEAETQTLMSFIEAHHIQALISYHSAALGVFPGGLPWDSASTRLAESIAEVSSYPFPPIDTGCTYSGTLADYAVSKGLAAVDLELTNHFDSDFDLNLDVLNVLVTFAQ